MHRQLLKVCHAVSLHLISHLANELVQIEVSQQAMLLSGETCQFVVLAWIFLSHQIALVDPLANVLSTRCSFALEVNFADEV